MKALWFSGGKDSMACLYMLRKELPSIYVLWANTGKNYPELIRTVNHARAMCPNWVEVLVDRDAQWVRDGMPADIVPVDYTKFGQAIAGKKDVMLQSYLACCFENITEPLLSETRRLGATTIIKGQRLEDSRKSPVRDGAVVGDLTYSHPIENWTTKEVLDYLRKEMGADYPKHYELKHSSMDCYDCTAYVVDSADRVAHMEKEYPVLFADYNRKMNKVSQAVRSIAKTY